ncbi:MAG: hypothetical protein AAFQ68_28135, partial [Bacteroidota bacterium]
KDWTQAESDPQDPDQILKAKESGHETTYLLCNRGEHNEAFEDPLQLTLKDAVRRPQFYFLHGPFEEMPHSLADRFYVYTVGQVLKRLEEPIAPGRFARWEMKFPTARDFENKRHPDKAFLSLQKHFSDSELGLPAHGQQVLQRLGQQHRVILLQHNMMAADWHPDMVPFLQRYISEFWQVELMTRQPQIVVVFNLTYHVDKGLGAFFKKRKDSGIQDSLLKLSQRIPQCHYIDRLRPINRNEVADWQRDYLPHYPDLLDQIKWSRNEAPMQNIESLLRKLLQQASEQNQ